MGPYYAISREETGQIKLKRIIKPSENSILKYLKKQSQELAPTFPTSGPCWLGEEMSITEIIIDITFS